MPEQVQILPLEPYDQDPLRPSSPEEEPLIPHLQLPILTGDPHPANPEAPTTTTATTTTSSTTTTTVRWQPTSYTRTTFRPAHFRATMDNLVRNPNLTSSHLFRADILYDSDLDRGVFDFATADSANNTTTTTTTTTTAGSTTIGPTTTATATATATTPYASSPRPRGGSGQAGRSRARGKEGLVGHMRAEVRPKPFEDLGGGGGGGFVWRRTVVRELVPRNRDLDRAMVQTCHFFTGAGEGEGEEDCEEEGEAGDEEGQEGRRGGWRRSLVVYLPHVEHAEDMPFYHPKVAGLCFVHACRDGKDVVGEEPSAQTDGGVAIHLLPFSGLAIHELEPKISRTVLKLLETISKHSHGAAQGYTKRVYHDRIIPQSRFQNTYARLKSKYAKDTIDKWAEVTDPGKHVFEDLGIAAFLIELWRDMYRERPFPGFVDIGCGNGLLTYLLCKEGYTGWGFDIRRRKSWSVYEEKPEMKGLLKEAVLVPDVLNAEELSDNKTGRNGGIFKPGTFIVSNHADELTAWTPLLAWLNNSPWIAIPCCSHDFAGRRFRAPARLRVVGEKRDSKATTPLHALERLEAATVLAEQREPGYVDTIRERQAAETGSLKRPESRCETDSGTDGASAANQIQPGQHPSKQQPSAYASLCTYVQRIAEAVEYTPETEMLRIPSTRNACIVGRRLPSGQQIDGCGLSEVESQRRLETIRTLVQSETQLTIQDVRKEWLQRAGLVASKKGEGH